MFDGMPYVAYERYIRIDPKLQNLVTSDLLKILIDKCNMMKKLLHDENKLFYNFSIADEEHKKEFNLKLESLIALMQKIAEFIL